MIDPTQPILLVGAGAMALEYARVLDVLDLPVTAFGRGTVSAEKFAGVTGITPTTGTLAAQIEETPDLPRQAIVAVNAMYLTDVVEELAGAGVQRLLVEKPAALDGAELARLNLVVQQTGADIRLAYNRRFLPSVLAASAMVEADGGVLSAKVDFSEPSRRIASFDKPQRELDTWFYGNSTHVVDLAVHFVGPCVEAHGQVAGEVAWHPAGGVFAGHARGASGALLSWHANWMGPGRWGLEIVTPQRRLVMQPLEQLRVQDHDSFVEHTIELDSDQEGGLKPGLLGQVRAFLFGESDDRLPSLAEHTNHWPLYETIRTGGSWAAKGTA
jgi:predicted dehydrogenase